jgi:hypothetical protein
MDGHTHNMKISQTTVGITQHGVYDSKILCKDCDGKIGIYDNYAVDVSRRFPKEHIACGDGTFEMVNVDGDKLAKFILSVLWRASISSRPEFRAVRLGVYESKACEVIFGIAPLSSMPEYELLLGRYTSTKINPARNYTAPSIFKIAGLNGWGFALGGFRVMAKIDSRRLSHELRSAVVNDNTRLWGAFVNYEGTTEGQAMFKMAHVQYARL